MSLYLGSSFSLAYRVMSRGLYGIIIATIET
jgi:hypothetical protein